MVLGPLFIRTKFDVTVPMPMYAYDTIFARACGYDIGTSSPDDRESMDSSVSLLPMARRARG